MSISRETSLLDLLSKELFEVDMEESEGRRSP